MGERTIRRAETRLPFLTAAEIIALQHESCQSAYEKNPSRMP
ncbi:hypothetical protein ABIE13_004911 [Ottowia thiooxydans]|uniref:Integrase n=1 Tax=Ottowia thiooxydans TaxID=219182 RepID=A0ABV2QFF7_9BURK